jgi:hypothetical protein
VTNTSRYLILGIFNLVLASACVFGSIEYHPESPLWSLAAFLVLAIHIVETVKFACVEGRRNNS